MKNIITLQLGDVETTALIPVAIKANETLSKNPRVKDPMAVEIVKHLKMDTAQFNKFLSREGVIARTVMLDRTVREFVAANPDARFRPSAHHSRCHSGDAAC